MEWTCMSAAAAVSQYKFQKPICVNSTYFESIQTQIRFDLSDPWLRLIHLNDSPLFYFNLILIVIYFFWYYALRLLCCCLAFTLLKRSWFNFIKTQIEFGIWLHLTRRIYIWKMMILLYTPHQTNGLVTDWLPGMKQKNNNNKKRLAR